MTSINGVAFSPDRQLVVSGSFDKIAWLWDAKTGAARRMLQDYTCEIRDTAFSLGGHVRNSVSLLVLLIVQPTDGSLLPSLLQASLTQGNKPLIFIPNFS